MAGWNGVRGISGLKQPCSRFESIARIFHQSFVMKMESKSAGPMRGEAGRRVATACPLASPESQSASCGAC